MSNDKEPHLTHDDASAALAAAALDALSAEEQAAVVAHAEQCPTCGPELAELRAAMASLSLAAPAPETRGEVDARLARVRGRLMARVQTAGAAGAPPAGRPMPARSNAWLWVALAASFLVAAAL